MTKNCLLVQPNEFSFFCPGQRPIKDERCFGTGKQNILFDVIIPSGSDAAVVEIQLTNTRTDKSETYFVYAKEKCSCSNNCFIDFGIQYSNKYSININIDNLIPGEHYSGIACANYIDSATGV
jgi:hypothetical protein